ncbi:hypothetical protein BpHYR1_024749 [Brachionus plicatilis]|uniref:Uncharacterized protein n=1 Tax=Brachionus plicatilis TaxID=10195 RepID=A0A3M7QTJ7_BRAPC|nr:hypothetical protein BpHYR1_024749 [Brachionus plicatilis]
MVVFLYSNFDEIISIRHYSANLISYTKQTQTTKLGLLNADLKNNEGPLKTYRNSVLGDACINTQSHM